jgi:hypothetical protein
MSLRLMRAVLVCVYAAVTLGLQAQICPQGSNPTIKYSGVNCSTGSSVPCGLTGPVTFTLVDYTGAPYTLQSCETSVTWSFGDGTGGSGLTVQHTYSTAGSEFVTVSLSSRFLFTNFLTANGAITMSGPSSVNEHDGAAVVDVHTDYAPTTVDYEAFDNGAAGGRFTPVIGTLSFAAGEHDKIVSIPIIDNTSYTGNGTIGLRLTNPTNGVLLRDSNGNYQTFGSGVNLFINLVDDDPPPRLNFSANSYTFSESVGTASIPVIRTGDLGGTVSTFWNAFTQNGFFSGTLIFSPNETTKTIDIPITNDSTWSPDRTFSVGLNGSFVGTGCCESANVTITDDDPSPTFSISDASVVEGNSGAKTAALTLTVSQALPTFTAINVAFGGTAALGRDYTGLVAIVFLNAGQTSKTIPISVIGNTTIEPDKTVTVTISGITGITSPSFSKRTGTLTIVNDDQGMAWLKLAAGTSGKMGIYLGNPLSAGETVTLTSSRPDIAKVPASFVAQAGRSTLAFDVQGLAVGTSLITAKFGGLTFTADVHVYSPAKLTVQPESLSIPVNTTGTTVVSLTPPPAAPISLEITNIAPAIVQAPPTVTIGTNGIGTMNIKGLAVGRGAVTITSPAENGRFDTTFPITVSPTPTSVVVTQVSPPNGPTAGGTQTAIAGLNFALPCSVTFAGTPASSMTFVSATSLQATTPPHGAGTVDVGVTCGADHFIFENGFTYVANPPYLTSLSPVSGNVHGGTTVVVSGNDLRSSCGVFFGGVAAKTVLDLTPGKLVVSTPAHGAGAVDVMVQCSDASSTLTSTFAFVTTAEPAAVISDIDPLFASPGQTVTVDGFRFRPADTITFDDARATILTTMPTSHVVVVPSLTPGKVAVTVTDPEGHTSTTGPIFTVLEAVTPEISSVTPSYVAPGGEIVITGKGFRAPYTFALGSKNAGSIVDLSFNRAVVRIDPTFATGTYTLGVLNTAGNLAAIGPRINVGAALTASSLSPACATADGGSDVTITGSGFQPGAQVAFGDNSSTDVRVVDDHTIIATVPAGKIGWPTITVTNPNGDATTLTRGFHYYSPYDLDGGCSSTKTRGVHH